MPATSRAREERSSHPGAVRAITADFVSTWGSALLKNFRSCGVWIAQRVKTQRAEKRMRLCESVSLGDRRFVAVIQVDQERFLIGGSSTSVCMLTKLQPEERAGNSEARSEWGTGQK